MEPESGLLTYLPHFGCREEPFRLSANPRLIYPSPQQLRSYAQLFAGIHAEKGILVLVGESGTGKSLLLRKLADELKTSGCFVFSLCNPQPSFEEILTECCQRVGDVDDSVDFQQRANLFTEFLAQRVDQRQITVMLVDEAEHLPDEVFRQLLGLTAHGMDGRRVLQVVFSGKPGLDELLNRPSLAEFKQAVSVHCELRPLEARDIRHFVLHRLRVAGCENTTLFSNEAIAKIALYSGGKPGLINVLCNNALRIASFESKDSVSADIIQEAALDCGLIATSGHSVEDGIPVTAKLDLASIVEDPRGETIARDELLIPDAMGADATPESSVVDLAAWRRSLAPDVSIDADAAACDVSFAERISLGHEPPIEASVPAIVPQPEFRLSTTANDARSAPRSSRIALSLFAAAVLGIAAVVFIRADFRPLEQILTARKPASEQPLANVIPIRAEFDDDKALPQAAVAATKVTDSPTSNPVRVRELLRSPADLAEGTQHSAVSTMPASKLVGQTTVDAYDLESGVTRAQSASNHEAAEPTVSPASDNDEDVGMMVYPDSDAIEEHELVGSTTDAAKVLKPVAGPPIVEADEFTDTADRMDDNAHLADEEGSEDLATDAAKMSAEIAVPVGEIDDYDRSNSSGDEFAQLMDKAPPQSGGDPAKVADVDVTQSAAPGVTASSAVDRVERPVNGDNASGTAPLLAVNSTSPSLDQVTAQESEVPSPNAPPDTSTPRSSRSMDTLLARGDRLLELHDLAAARLVYEWAAAMGNAQAIMSVGKTYDPSYFAAARVRGVTPEPALALEWYRKAIKSGDQEASSRLQALTDWLEQRGGRTADVHVSSSVVE